MSFIYSGRVRPMTAPIIETRNLTKYFKTPKGMLHAVDNVSLKIDAGRTLGVVGESGCGKTTLGRTVLRLTEATGGEVLYRGDNILKYSKKQFAALRREMQIIFQDPYASLNPRRSVSEAIADPLKVNTKMSRREIDERVKELMDTVGLAQRLINSYPHELDGGRRQRIGIARALALKPKFIVCDEPVSALDVSIQAQILNLLMDLQEQIHLSYMFITHDLSVVKHISDDIMVMYLGQCVEKAPKTRLFVNPLHPYTKALMNAIPIPSLDWKKEKHEIIHGEVTSPINPPPGCRFASRCPYAMAVCREKTPEFSETEPEHFTACHLFDKERQT